jgi:hypothetical protein
VRSHNLSDVTDVFVLGAGFSRAVGDPMPLTADLGLRVLDGQKSIHRSRATSHSDVCDGLSCDYPLLAGGRHPDDFEAWLTSLAEPQPYLFGPENDRRKALFEELAGLIDVQIKFAEAQVLSGSEPPAWLTSLVDVWHRSKANVLTFNYDTIIEATLDFIRIPDPTQKNEHPITHLQLGPSLIPNWGVMYGGLRLRPAETFDYIKLHGSTHWYWDETTKASDSIVQVGLRSGWVQPDPLYSSEELEFRAPGKAAMIVPPTTAKSVYMGNPIIRLLWRMAYRAMLAADRIFVLGYSMPPGDLLVRTMIGDSIVNGRQKSIWIVNPTEAVAGRFEGFDAEVITTHCGEGFRGIDAFVQEYLSVGGL